MVVGGIAHGLKVRRECAQDYAAGLRMYVSFQGGETMAPGIAADHSHVY